jgi:uncharacterized delta-60 repeat protein
MKLIFTFFFSSIAIINLSFAQDTAFVTKGFYVTKDPYLLRCAQQQADGRILISGDFTHFNGTPSTNLVRLFGNGTRDTSFNKQIGTNGSIDHIVVQKDSMILLQGVFSRYMQQTVTTGLIRIDSNGVMDQTFNPYKPVYGYNGVTAMALQPDGKLIIAGFGIGTQGYDTCGLIRLNKDGSLDINFKPGSVLQQYNTINVITVQKNGKILIGGTFSSWKETPAKGLVQLNNNGDRDNSFAPNGSNFQTAYSSSTPSIHAIRELPDSSLLIGGNFAFFNGLFRMGLVKLLPNGNLDYTFSQEPSITLSSNFIVYDIAVTNENKILLGGHFYISGNPYYDLIVLQQNGLAETNSPFSGPDPSQSFTAAGISKIFVNPDNSFLAFGSFAGFYNGVYKNNLALYNSQHQADPSFVNGLQRKGSVTQTIPQADNKILVAGDFNQYDLDNLLPRQYIARLKRDGSLDAVFQNTELNGRISAIAQQNDSAILAVGSFSKVGSTQRYGITRFTRDGLLDASFDPGIGPNDNNMYCVRPYKNQYIYVGGSFSQFAGTAHQGIARLFPNGSLDNSFITSTTPVYAPASIEVTSDGKVLAAESSDKTNRDYTTRLRLYKLLEDGKLDPSFQTPQLGWSMSKKVREGKNGAIYWLGQLIQQYSPTRFEQTLICLKPNGSLDSSARRLPSDYIISDFSILPDSNLIVCGQKITGVDSTNFVLRLKPDLSIDSSFIPVALYYDLKHINYSPEGNIVIAGEAKRYFRIANDQIQNVGLLRNSSMQIESSTGATTRIVNNMIDSVAINQSVDVSNSAAQNFTAANPSNMNISLLDPNKIIVTGPNASEFSVTLSSNNQVITKKGALPFTITFTPKSEGKKFAVITIPYSNGIDNKYSFVLWGTGTNRVTSVFDVPGGDHNVYVYPNPSTLGKIYLRSKNAIDHYFVTDASGKEVFSGQFASPNSENKEILLQGLKPGLYFIHLKGKKVAETVKLLVVK